MEGYVLDAVAVPENEIEQTITEMFGDNITMVNLPWHSHGAVLEVPPLIYFKGDLNNSRSLCGNDSLCMTLGAMTPAGSCPVDNALSYLLVPDSTSDNT